jgi:phosphohistidine phosphatase
MHSGLGSLELAWDLIGACIQHDHVGLDVVGELPVHGVRIFTLLFGRVFLVQPASSSSERPADVSCGSYLGAMRLQIMRHGKSDWYSDAETDHDRPLAARGVTAAKRMGALLTRIGEPPDVVLTSSAVRARTTAELAHEAGGWTATIRVHPELYGTSPAGALAVARSAPDGVERVMLVGHEPTWGMLAQQLSGGRVAVKTATVIGVDVPGTRWSSLPETGGAIAYVLQPRLFGDWILEER